MRTAVPEPTLGGPAYRRGHALLETTEASPPQAWMEGEACGGDVWGIG